jgi:hypothetical protein
LTFPTHRSSKGNESQRFCQREYLALPCKDSIHSSWSLVATSSMNTGWGIFLTESKSGKEWTRVVNF